jgi:hypothetical protein
VRWLRFLGRLAGHVTLRMGTLMKPLGIVNSALILMFASACGGGGSSSAPSAPSAATASAPTPTPTTITVYASHDQAVHVSPAWPAEANEPEPWFMVNHLGWGYNFTADNVRFSRGWGLAFKFDVQSQIAGRSVSKAALWLDVLTARTDLSITPRIRVNAFMSDWDPSTLTWNIWAGLACQATGEAQAAAPSSLGPFAIDVTTIVRNWASGAWNNYGFRLMVNEFDPGYTPSNAITTFHSLGSHDSPSQRPRLIVDFQ